MEEGNAIALENETQSCDQSFLNISFHIKLNIAFSFCFPSIFQIISHHWFFKINTKSFESINFVIFYK